MNANSTYLSPQNPANQLADLAKRQGKDALTLLEFAIESGFTTDAGTRISPELVIRIRRATEDIMASETIGPKQWAEFAIAYYQLTTLMTPVTAATVRDTREVGSLFKDPSPAQAFTRWLWSVTIVFAFVVAIGELSLLRYGPAEEGIVSTDGSTLPNTFLQILQVLAPYAYGGLGACVYLLRSAHRFIYERTFDLRRKPEYFNRILLGVIAGSATPRPSIHARKRLIAWR